jgi:hypothetical protein
LRLQENDQPAQQRQSAPAEREVKRQLHALLPAEDRQQFLLEQGFNHGESARNFPAHLINTAL